ncbi:FliM/FliN family flagellar motor switch protein [Pirellulaceae bacterium SH449]
MGNGQKLTTTDPAKVDFWKSLLRISSDVTVTLAKKNIPVERILSFVPGVMIQFDKACDTPLNVEIDDRKIAQGEVVKVGDKFGLRITEIAECEESWIPLVTEKPKS